MNPSAQTQTIVMKNSKRSVVILLVLITLPATRAQVTPTKTRCSYFMLANWQAWYPGQFRFRIDPGAGTLEVEPLHRTFIGVISLSIHESLQCGNAPLCAHAFGQAGSGVYPLPEEVIDCIEEASPLFVRICWVEELEIAKVRERGERW